MSAGDYANEGTMLLLNVEREPAAVAERLLGPRVVGVLMALMLFTLAVTNGSQPSLESAAFTCAASVLVGVISWKLLSIGAIPGVLLVSVLGFAYIPTAWDAVAVGFDRSNYRTTSDGLSLALLTLFGQVCVTALASWWGTTTSISSFVVSPVRALLVPHKHEEPLLIAFAIFFCAALIGGVMDGQWSYYAPGATKFDEQSLAGGFRLALLYGDSLLAASALAGHKLAHEDQGRRWRWLIVSLLLLVLLFLHQGRRFMLASVGMMVLPQISRWRPGVGQLLRGTAALSFAALAIASLLYGSLIWRAALHQAPQDTTSQLRGMAQVEVGAKETIDNLRDRLTYLWIDTVAMELGSRKSDPGLLLRSLGSSVASNIPGVLYPEKYRWQAVTCETILVEHGRLVDLPCTPLAEGVLLGGAVGVVAVLALWGFGVALASALYSSPDASGKILCAATLASMVTIESSAFPLVASMRALVLFAGFLAPLAWLSGRIHGGGLTKR